jgi:hypothetical protein
MNSESRARVALDVHVREIVNWHFDPATGSPFWLDYANALGWDPRTEIRGFGDLSRFPPFEDEWLRGGPVQRWIPKGFAGRPVFVFETGGTTGIPKTRVAFDDFRTDYELFSTTLPDEYFPKGSNWLMLGPSGPRRLRLAVEHLAQFRGGICFCVDLDPRWVIKLIKKGWMDHLEAYKTHVIDQAVSILQAGHDIRCMFTDIDPQGRYHGHFFRRNGIHSAMESIRARGVARRRLHDAHVWQHAHGAGRERADRR